MKDDNSELLDTLPAVLPVIIRDEGFLYPFMITPLFFSKDEHKHSINYALSNNNLITIGVCKNNKTKEPYDIAITGSIMRKTTLSDGSFKILFQGLSKVAINEIQELECQYNQEDELHLCNKSSTKSIDAKIHKIKFGMCAKFEYKKQEDTKAVIGILKDKIKTIASLGNSIASDFEQIITKSDDDTRVLDLVCSALKLSDKNVYEIFNQTSLKESLLRLLQELTNEITFLKIKNKIEKQVSASMHKYNKKHYLKEQLKIINKELGGKKNNQVEIFKKKLKKLKKHMPKQAYKESISQLKNMQSAHDSTEESMLSSYLQCVTSIPFNKTKTKDIQIQSLQKQLDKDHYGLQKAKDAIIEHFSVIALKKQRNIKTKDSSNILCFIGPPGVGKTSLAKSIAKSLKRKLARISLGGLDDVSELKGHRRTYIGAMCGRFVNALIDTKTLNPVIVLDEIDKISKGYRGDASAVMLEVLDSEQNDKFRDYYLNFDIDLSKCIFIATANDISKISPPLRDRIEFIHIDSYTPSEKYNIAKDYLIPKELKANGLNSKDITISKEIIKLIIDTYTLEAGVRNLKRAFRKIYAKVAKKIITNKAGKKAITIDKNNISEYLQKPINELVKIKNTSSVGIANGLSWSEVGGDVLKIESIMLDSKTSNIKLTGNMGDVMKESANIAFSVAKNMVAKSKYKDLDISTKQIHLHIPEGAISKDGPSAGIAMALSIYSTLTNKKIKQNIAMTGELTLSSEVLAIGGLKEKAIAGYKAGVKTIIIPKRNYQIDMQDIPKEIKDNINFVSVESFDEVLKIAIQN